MSRSTAALAALGVVLAGCSTGPEPGSGATTTPAAGAGATAAPAAGDGSSGAPAPGESGDPGVTTGQACGPVPEEARQNRYDAATRQDQEFTEQFCHGFAQVEDVTMHYVTGGSGPPLVLLHGWPQSWFEWRDLLPALAERHTVIAVDLPGLGDSLGAPPSFDKATLARYVHGLVAGELGFDRVGIAAHDLGAGVAFQYAAQFPEAVDRLVHMDYPIPGPGVSAQQLGSLSWHFAFHYQEEVPELLVDDEVREYLAAFYPEVAYGSTAYGGDGSATTPFTDAEIDEYARTYDRPQVLHGGFELYRTLATDEQDNTAAGPVDVPTMIMVGQGALAFTRPAVVPLLPTVVREVEVPGAGHWLTEENPEVVTRELLDFFAG